MAPIDRHALPDRSYYLMTGPVTTATELQHPGDDGWLNLDLFWPDDRQGFIATDVDFWYRIEPTTSLTP